LCGPKGRHDAHRSAVRHGSEAGSVVNFRRHFDRLTAAAGIGQWSPNELPHSAVSLLSAAGVALEDIADIVGHDGTRMTAGVCRHTLTPFHSKGVAPADALFGTETA
jgi:hypothetical protein